MRTALVTVTLLLGPFTGAASASDKQNLDSTCGNTRIDIGFADTAYHALNDNGEGKVGPRRLVVEQSGTITSSFTRLFVAHTPMDIDKAIVTIKKTSGRGETSVAICATDAANHQRVLSQFTIPNGTDNEGHTWTRDLDGIKSQRVSVRFKGHSATNSMNYTLDYSRPHTGQVSEPTDAQLHPTVLPRPVTGFADLHAHHASRWGFGSAWYFGAMDGAIGTDPPSHYEDLKVKLAGIKLQDLRPGHQGIHWPDSSDTSHQSMGYDALYEAHQEGLRLMVAPAVNNEWLCSVLAYVKKKPANFDCEDMESAKYQIMKMKQFDAAHDWYEIVRNPWQARDAIGRGHLAVILGVEVSNILPKSDGPWDRQLDELYSMGVRVMYIAHESNSRFAGTAYHHTEDLKFPNELTSWFSKDIHYASEHGDDVTHNAVGLSVDGYKLVNELMEHRMLIDVDHISWKAADSVAEITEDNDWYPIYAGHTRMKGLMPPEQAEITPELNTTPKTFDAIVHSGGMFGLRLGPERVKTYSGSHVTNDCDGSIKSWAQTYANVLDRGGQPAFGSDFNGFVEMISSRLYGVACRGAQTEPIRHAQQVEQTSPPVSRIAEPSGTVIANPFADPLPPSWATYKSYGMADISTEGSALRDLRYLGVNTDAMNRSAQAYIDMWKRAYDDDRKRVP